MSTPTRVVAGTPVGRLLRASTINYALEGAELAHRLSTGERGTQTSLDRGGRVLVRNDTGADIDERFRILGLTDILIDPGDSDEAARHFKEHFAFIGEKPDSERDGPGRIGVAQAPVKDGKLVQCIVSGPTVAYLELADGETYTSAELETDDHEKFVAAEHGQFVVMWHETGPGTKLAVINLAAVTKCEYIWEFDIFPGSAMPTSGTAIFTVEIDGDSQDVTIDWDMTAAELTTELLAEFAGLSADDIECTGGPLPTIPIDVEWKTRSLLPDWAPTVGASTLNNSAVCKVRQRNPR